MKLYEINQNIERILNGEDERCLNENGEPDIEKIKELLTHLNEELDLKAENIAVFIKNLSNDEEGINSEIANLQKRKNTIQKKRERAQEFLKEMLLNFGKSKIESSRVAVKLTSRNQLVYDETEIPQGWYREKVAREIDKQLIKEAVRQGEVIPGVTEAKRHYISIK